MPKFNPITKDHTKDIFLFLSVVLMVVGLVVVVQNLAKILWNLTTPIVEAVR